MKYKSVMVTRRGGPEVMQVVENDLRPPAPKEVRIRVLATGVGRTDVNYRHGSSPFSPKVPFVPGYEIVGLVEAVGEDVHGIVPGDRVAALTGQGGYAEMIYLGPEYLVPVPPALVPEEVVGLILNYVTAYQMLHRVARVTAGDKVLIIGASGGVGTALLQLGKLAGLKMYGTASSSKHGVLSESGATPIDYHTQDFGEVLRQAEPGGLDFVFDGMGGEYSARGLALLLGMIKLAVVNLLPNGKSAEFYGISAFYMRDKKPFMEDLAKLFKMLAEGQVKPIITARFPILEARKANELLESGQAIGNIVLLTPELLNAGAK